jgi:hypothetical protein
VSRTPILARASATRHVEDGNRPRPYLDAPAGAQFHVTGDGKDGWWMGAGGSFRLAWTDMGRRVSQTATRNDDGSWRHEVVEEVEREESDAYFSRVLLSPLAIVYLRWYARVTADTLKAKVGDLVEELSKYSYSTSSMGHAPSSIVPSLEVSEDQYGLLNAKLTLAVQWPSGSYGTTGWEVSSDGEGVVSPYGSDGGLVSGKDVGEDLEPYFVLRFADTMMAAGRGQNTLIAFMQRQYEESDADAGYTLYYRRRANETPLGTVGRGARFAAWLDEYAKVLQTMSDIYAAFFGLTFTSRYEGKYYDPATGIYTPKTVNVNGAVTIPIENIRAGVMYSVDRVNASLDPSTGHWTASYTFANMTDNLSKIKTYMNTIVDMYDDLVLDEFFRKFYSYITQSAVSAKLSSGNYYVKQFASQEEATGGGAENYDSTTKFALVHRNQSGGG